MLDCLKQTQELQDEIKSVLVIVIFFVYFHLNYTHSITFCVFSDFVTTYTLMVIPSARE